MSVTIPDTGTRVTARIAVDPDDPVFPGHYPGFPVLPGLYLLEYVLDTARSALPGPVRLAAVERCRFLGPVYPGDAVDIEATLTALPGDSIRRWHCAARVETDAGRCAELRLLLVEEVEG